MYTTRTRCRADFNFWLRLLALVLVTVTPQCRCRLLSLSYSPAGGMIAAGCYNGKIYFLDAGTQIGAILFIFRALRLVRFYLFFIFPYIISFLCLGCILC
jgi:hypothetical protein